MKEALGDIISNRRKELHLTQSQLAERFGISDKAVSKWERNLSRPDEKFMPDLVEFLGLPSCFLPDDTACDEENSWHTILKTIKDDAVKIVCIAIAVSSIICLATGLLTDKESLIMFGIPLIIFGYITLLKK